MSVADQMQFDNICRTCLSEEQNMKSIFDIDCSLGDTHQLFEMLMACTSVQVQEDDGLPAQICLSCINHLARSFSFKKLCEDSDATLREVLRKSTIIDSEPLIALKPSSYVALCPQEIVTEIDTDPLDIGIKFEDNETKIDHALISDTEFIDYEEDIKTDLAVGGVLNVQSSEIEICQSTVDMRSFEPPILSVKVCDKSELKQHTPVHTREIFFQCHLCSKMFLNRNGLGDHIKSHMDHRKRNHICAYCHKGFCKASKLKQHMLTHTGEKPHTCPICNKSFARVDNLNTHLKRH